MIADLKTYPEYKESGQEWLGEVPAHWELKPGHAAFDKRKIPNRGLKENTVLSLSFGKIKVKPTDKQHGLVPESYETYQIVDEGNIIIRGTDLQNDKTSLRIGLVRNRGIISSAYLCLQCRDTVTPEYGYQILNTFDLTKAIYLYGSGLRQNLDHGEIKRLPIFLPPLSEQSAIVRFLDYWNGRLEKAIRAKRRVIALLQEQKQAIIHRAVTRGLDPKVTLKDSGIPWLGEIPEHWDSVPNRANLKIRKCLVGDRSSEYTLLSLTIRGVIARDMENPTGKFPAEFNTYQEVRPGDLIFCLFDIDETPRGVGISRLHGMITGAYTVFEAKDPEVAEFLYLHYLAMDKEKCLKPLYTGLRKTIPKPRFLGIKTPVPPREERIAIVQHIKGESERIEKTITRFEREITLLREYRTRLTADVVTGKLDVRAAAAHLPAPEPEPTETEAEEIEEETEMEEIG